MMRALDLSDDDQAMLDGERGEAAALAMRIVVELAGVMQADRLISVTSAHVDGCLYHGLAGLDFAERLVAGGGRVSIPTTLNVSSLDLLHPNLVRTDPERTTNSRRLMDCYVEMGCRPTWTCAPYQLAERPAFGEHIAWAESNAIVFANSVLGARTNRYGDFIDICAAITGQVPFAGYHRDDARNARIVFRLGDDIPDRLLHDPILGALVGHVIGMNAENDVPAIVGLPSDTSEDLLKALGAGAASSGAVAMFHAVGVTPEAPTLEAALGGTNPSRESTISLGDVRAARDELTTMGNGGEIGSVSVGTPHASLGEIRLVADAIDRGYQPRVPLFINLGRDVHGQIDTRARGVTYVTDTCTYLAPIIRDVQGPVMTNSAKWAWYAPGNLGLDVVIGSLEECVRSAALGRVWRDPGLWGDQTDG